MQCTELAFHKLNYDAKMVILLDTSATFGHSVISLYCHIKSTKNTL